MCRALPRWMKQNLQTCLKKQTYCVAKNGYPGSFTKDNTKALPEYVVTDT